ncbi:MAG TPA: SET domain-containing protein-lysine N-methyltransferase [Nevskiaceae bacterium]|nr:SET domain-containing protein-lysine N-methyltransferase [Nevskiaceae bacterium]
MPRNLLLRRSPIHGNGVFAARDLPAGLRLIEYRGRRLTHAQADRLYDGGIESGHTFLFTLNDRFVVDGNQQGNIARWLNHSCEPNCEALVVEARDGDPRRDQVWLETLRPVAAGEELTYDYGIVLEVRHSARLKALWACRCGSPRCTGTLLKPKRRR